MTKPSRARCRMTPRCLSASLWAGQFVVLQLEAVGLLMPVSYHAGGTGFVQQNHGQDRTFMVLEGRRA